MSEGHDSLSVQFQRYFTVTVREIMGNIVLWKNKNTVVVLLLEVKDRNYSFVSLVFCVVQLNVFK